MPIRFTKKFKKFKKCKKYKKTISKRGGGGCGMWGPFELSNYGVFGGCGFDIEPRKPDYEYVSDQKIYKKDKNGNLKYYTTQKYWIDVKDGKVTKITSSKVGEDVDLKKAQNGEFFAGSRFSDEELTKPSCLFEMFPYGFWIGEKVYKNIEYPKLTEDQVYTSKAYDKNKPPCPLKKFNAGLSKDASTASQVTAALWHGREILEMRLSESRDPKYLWTSRLNLKKDIIDYNGKNIDCGPFKFGDFDVLRWGGTGGYGFNIWDNNGRKFWIEIDPFLNIALEVKDESNCALGNIGCPLDHDKTNNLMKIEPEEARTPLVTHPFFLKLFPEGYKISEKGETIKNEPSQVAAAVAPVAVAVAPATEAGTEAGTEAPVTEEPAVVKKDPALAVDQNKKLPVAPVAALPSYPSQGGKKTTKRRKNKNKNSKKRK
jgi:hypothetical protein